jgi:hypothetical protein
VEENNPKYNNNNYDELDIVSIVCGIVFLVISIIEISDTKGKSLFDVSTRGRGTGLSGGIFSLILSFVLLYFPIKKRIAAKKKKE